MTELEQLEQAMAALEAQRAILGDAVVEAGLAPMREKLAIGKTQQPSTEQQRKQVTVLFADVSGFTAMSETMDAEEVTEIMNALWLRLDTAIIAHDGKIDKHIGDAVMALWGVGTAREDDPRQAIRAALAMQAELLAFAAATNHPLRMRIGLNTGPVLLGVVGTKDEYTAMGDTVNVASRLEHAAPVGGILISHNTYRHVRGLFEVQTLEPISVKGKTEPIQIYLVEGAKPHTFRIRNRGVEGLETRMIGREAELQQLQETLYTAVKDSESQVVMIVGEAGIGKSRLLDEFNHWLELSAETVWLFKGRADRQMSQLPYALIRDLLATRFEIQDSDPAAVARDKLEQGLTDILGAEQVEKAHFIGQLMGFDFSDSPYLAGILDDAKQLYNRAFPYLTHFFANMANDHPVVIFLEDLHWADKGSLDFIDYLAHMCRQVSLLIVCLVRPSFLERRPLWGEGQEFHTRLVLRPLSKREGRRLVEEILRQMLEIPPDLRELIVNGAEGNPFYVEELIKTLIEDGVIVTGPEQWQVELQRLAEIQVPPTLVGVLQARLDRLLPSARETLQGAAVVGRVFWDKAVTHLRSERHDESSAGGSETLNVLRGKEMIFARETSVFAGTQEYTFKHAILREVTYESVLKRVRRRYHTQVASWLIEQSGERVEEYDGLIGEHYERAGEIVQAVHWYALAGQQAQKVYANEVAVSWYKRTLVLLDQLDPKQIALFQTLMLSVHRSLGKVLTRLGQYDEALQHYQRAAQVLLETDPLSTDEAHQLADLCRRTAEVYERRSEYDAAFTWLAKGLSYLDETEPTLEAAHLYRIMAWVNFRQGQYDEATEWCQKSLATASALKTREGQQALAKAYEYLSSIHTRQGDLGLSMQICREVVQIYQQLGDLVGQSRGYHNLGVTNYYQGNWTQASDAFHKSLTIKQEIGDIFEQGVLTNNLALIFMDRGEWDRAIDFFEQSHAIARQISAPTIEGMVLSNLAQVHLYRQNWAEAQACLSRSQTIATEVGFGELMPELERRWGEFHLKTGNLEKALTHTQHSIELALAQEAKLEEGMSYRIRGQIYLAQGEDEQAKVALQQSLGLLTELNSEYEAAKTQLVLARLAQATGLPSETRLYLTQAMSAFEKLGAQADLSEARELEKQLD